MVVNIEDLFFIFEKKNQFIPFVVFRVIHGKEVTSQKGQFVFLIENVVLVLEYLKKGTRIQ